MLVFIASAERAIEDGQAELWVDNAFKHMHFASFPVYIYRYDNIALNYIFRKSQRSRWFRVSDRGNDWNEKGIDEARMSIWCDDITTISSSCDANATSSQHAAHNSPATDWANPFKHKLNVIIAFSRHIVFAAREFFSCIWSECNCNAYIDFMRQKRWKRCLWKAAPFVHVRRSADLNAIAVSLCSTWFATLWTIEKTPIQSI